MSEIQEKKSDAISLSDEKSQLIDFISQMKPSERYGVLFDRDGVCNRHREDHVKSVDEFTIVDSSVRAMRWFVESGFPVGICTSKSGIALGLFTKETLGEIQKKFNRAVGHCIPVFYCPHKQQIPPACSCRKPDTKLLKGFCRHYKLNPKNCIIIGDQPNDIRAGALLHSSKIVQF